MMTLAITIAVDGGFSGEEGRPSSKDDLYRANVCICKNKLTPFKIN